MFILLKWKFVEIEFFGLPSIEIIQGTCARAYKYLNTVPVPKKTICAPVFSVWIWTDPGFFTDPVPDF